MADQNPCTLNDELFITPSRLIALFSWSNAPARQPAEVKKKIEIIQADALKWRRDPKVALDFLYADIWHTVDEPQTLADVRKMQSTVRSEMIYYWGQELTLHAMCSPRLSENSSLDHWVNDLRNCRDDDIGLSMLRPTDIVYVDFVRGVANQTSLRRPNVFPDHHD